MTLLDVIVVANPTLSINAFTVRVVVRVPTYLLSYLASKTHHHISITIKKAELLLYAHTQGSPRQGSLSKVYPTELSSTSVLSYSATAGGINQPNQSQHKE